MPRLHVGRVAVVPQLEQDLGRHVRLAPADVVQHLALAPLARAARHGAWVEVSLADVLVGEAEVGELARAAGADQHVLELEVAVGDPLRVEELDHTDDLAEVAQRLGLGQNALAGEEIQQVARAELQQHDDAVAIGIRDLVGAVQPDNTVVVRHLAQQPHLGQDLGPPHTRCIDHLGGGGFTRALLISCPVHAAERAAADDRAEVDAPPAHAHKALCRAARHA